MTRYYKTGEFAKMAKVSQRTIRYYDKIGLLKPSKILENGYRQYDDNDFIKLQKIISLRHLGFSIDEIFPLMANDQNLEDSLKMQMQLIDTKMTELQTLKDALAMTENSIKNKTFTWNNLISLVQLMNRDNDLIQQYKDSTHLNVRISLHEKYSKNPVQWFDWLQSQIQYSQISRLLEVGCGNGRLWKNVPVDLRNREVFLSDNSDGMIDEVRKHLGSDFNCMVFDCQHIPFKDQYFDAVIANHVLFYLKDIHMGLKEIQRVLRKGGYFYCSAYGKDHMKEITEIAQAFDARVQLSQNQLFMNFGLENGREILSHYFSDIQLHEYQDHLEVDDAQALVDYIMSCHGNQNEILGPKIHEFKKYVHDIIEKEQFIFITKQVGVFICRK